MKHICILFTTVMLSTMLATSCVSPTALKSEKEIDKEKLRNSQLGIVINYINRGLTTRAHKELRSLIHEHPNDPDFRNLMGLTQLALRQPRLASRSFRRAIELKDDPAFTLNLGTAFMEQKQYGKALSLLQKYIASGLNNYAHPERFYHNVGLVYEKTKKLKQAVKYYRLALDKNPSHYMTIMQLAKLFDAKDMVDQARKGYEQAINNCRACYAPVRLLAMSYARSGQKGRAAEILRKYAKLYDARSKDKADAIKLAQKIDPAAALSTQ
jgi:Tfp pilus assembly protein PilF